MTNDNLIRPAFTSKYLDEDKEFERRRTLNISLNDDEDKLLGEAKKILNQKKDGTAIKKLMEIGFIVLQEEKTRKIIDTIFINKNNNKRNGIVEFE